MQLFLAQHSQEFEEIYRLRYRAYRSIQAIDENSLQQFSDVFDKQDNCFIFGLKSGGGSIMASLRVLVSSHGHKGRDELTATKAFKDVIENEFSSHQILVESNRFVFDPPRKYCQKRF